MKKLFDMIFRNGWAKILCLLLALTLWVYVGIGQTKNANFPGNIPLQFKNVPSGLIAVSDTDKVTIKVVAENDVFRQLSVDSFSAYLDLNGLDEGNYEAKVNVITNTANVQIVEINPSRVVVRLESKIEKEIPVIATIDGKAGDGLVPGQAVIEPANVRVSGAKSVVNSLLEATAKIQLQGETADFKKVVKVVGLKANGQEISGLEFKPNQVTVSVPIVKASNIKTVGIKVVTTGAPSDGFWISKIETDPATVVITAAESQISKISFVETAQIDISNISKNTAAEIDLKPAAGVNIVDQVSKVKVNIFVSQNQATKEINTGFKWQGLAQNLKVSSVEPMTVKVILTGPQEKLENLSADDIALVVDLAGLNNPGTYSVDISRSSIAGPTGISVSSIVPSAVNVRLDTK